MESQTSRAKFEIIVDKFIQRLLTWNKAANLALMSNNKTVNVPFH